jgi:hypothetical protein
MGMVDGPESTGSLHIDSFESQTIVNMVLCDLKFAAVAYGQAFLGSSIHSLPDIVGDDPHGRRIPYANTGGTCIGNPVAFNRDVGRVGDKNSGKSWGSSNKC